MRCAIFTDVHANLEALEAVLQKIDAIAKEEPIDQFWFLGDLVGYGPNPNECISMLRERTEVIIAGNHDWAAVGKIDLEDFSPAARISAEWTMKQLTEEHVNFLSNLPERLEIGECTLVHGSPYGPLWEYLTSQALAERSFQYFSTRYCFVGHTHVPIIFQQLDVVANEPTHPLADDEYIETTAPLLFTQNGGYSADALPAHPEHKEAETEEIVTVPATPALHLQAPQAEQAESAYANPATGEAASEKAANILHEHPSHEHVEPLPASAEAVDGEAAEHASAEPGQEASNDALSDEAFEDKGVEVEADTEESPEEESDEEAAGPPVEECKDEAESLSSPLNDVGEARGDELLEDADADVADAGEFSDEEPEPTPEEVILSAEDRLNDEIEELLELLGLSESMIPVTNEMIVPPEGHWDAPPAYRAIINAGGVGQPRDGDPRAAFMIYDSEKGFEFYRIPYDFRKTQEKIMKAGLPHYLAVRLAYGR